jgi:hypothetical protein
LSFSPLRHVPTIALANLISLVVAIAAHADEIETPQRTLLADTLAASSRFNEEETSRFSTSFSIRKGRGIQFGRPIEVNDKQYEFNLSGPIVKSGPSKKEALGLSFELRF